MRHHRRGYIFADFVTGLGIVALLAGMLALAVNRNHAALEILANSRAASNLAKSALVTLEQKQKLTGDPRLSVRALPAEPGAAAIPGKTWVEITAKVNGQTEHLIALAPKEALP